LEVNLEVLIWKIGKCIGVEEGGRGARASPPLRSYPGRSGTYPDKFENTRANLKVRTFILEITLKL